MHRILKKNHPAMPFFDGRACFAAERAEWGTIQNKIRKTLLLL